MTATPARGERSPRASRPAVHLLRLRPLRRELRRILRPPVRPEAVRPWLLSLLALYDPRLAEHSARVARAMGALAGLVLGDELPAGIGELAGIRLGNPLPGITEPTGLLPGDLKSEAAELAGLLHDIGKLLVPHDLLFAPRLHTPEETARVRRHPVLGLALLPAGLDRRILDAVAHHHERWDGAGYPLGLASTRIPAVARLLAVVDAYDSMTWPRAYRSTLTSQQAREELAREAGSQFDPGLVPAYLDWLRATSRETSRP